MYREAGRVKATIGWMAPGLSRKSESGWFEHPEGTTALETKPMERRTFDVTAEEPLHHFPLT